MNFKHLFFLVATILFISTGCNKEKTCTCVTSATGTGSELYTPVTTSYTTEDSDCSGGESTVTSGTLTITTTCTED